MVRLRRLDFVVTRDLAVDVLVDGVSMLQSSWTDYIGFYPLELLGQSSPLEPTHPPRRVALAQCSCGFPESNALAALIVRDDWRVVWSDFRNFVGPYDGPLAEERDPEGGEALGLPDLEFAAEQYDAEIRRATDDRSWARLL